MLTIKSQKPQLRRSVKTHAHRFIYGHHDSFHGDYCKQLTRKGAYAITSLTVRLDDPKYTEKDVDVFLEEFVDACPLYINLKQLHLDAPYAALKGNTIGNLMQIESCHTELRLDIWTFHSPIDDQWKGHILHKVRVALNDGIAFPHAFPHILTGLAKHQSYLKYVHLKNQSPHRLVISKRLLPQRAFADIHDIEVEDDRTFLFL
jgi:hypothetical protein